jgi:DNA-binding response OmpR family regulator
MPLLLVEPEADLAEMLVFLLRREGHDVLTARDEAGATRRLAAPPPQLVITETELPQGSGWALGRAVRQAGATPLLFLGRGLAADEMARALEAGGDAYLQTPLSPRLFRAQVQALLRRAGQAAGQAGSGGQPLQVGDLRLDPQWRQVQRGAQHIRLTGIEFKLLHALALHAGQVLPYQTLVDRVWGYAALELSADASLLKGHIRNLRQKLGEDGAQPGYIQTMAGVGYRFRPQGAAPAPGPALAAAD